MPKEVAFKNANIATIRNQKQKLKEPAKKVVKFQQKRGPKGKGNLVY